MAALTSTSSTVKAAATDPAKLEAARKLLGLGLAGLGVGAVGRSVLGFRNMLQGPQKVPFISPGPSAVEVPILRYRQPKPPEEEDDDELPPGAVPAGPALQKLALDLQGIANAPAEGVASMLPDGGLAGMASDPMHSWAAMPVGVGLAGAGVMGGWNLTDWLLKQRKQHTVDDALHQARRGYQKALVEQFKQTAPVPKEAAADPYAQLDELYDELEKQANWFGDAANTAGGGAATLLGLTALGTGVGTYQWVKNRSRAAMLAKALQARSRQLWAQQPQQIYAVPKYVGVKPPAPDEDEAPDAAAA